MLDLLRALLFSSLAFFRIRRQLAIEILALRHQLGVLKRSVKRPRLSNVDRRLWVLLSRRRVGLERRADHRQAGDADQVAQGRVLSVGPQLGSPQTPRTSDRAAPSGATTFSGTTGPMGVERPPIPCSAAFAMTIASWRDAGGRPGSHDRALGRSSRSGAESARATRAC